MRGGRTYVLAAALLGAAGLLTIAGVGDRAGFPDWQAFVLGVVQGATELLPISSSGHLVLVPWLGDWTYLEQHDDFNHTFDVALHLGTMLAVGGYFLHDLVAMVRAFVRTLHTRRLETPDERLAWIVLIATIPAGVVGLALEDTITAHLGEPWQIAILLAVFAGLLWLVDRRPATREAHELSLKEGLAVGFAQALALAPGVSRSGITISAGRLFRLDRDAAARLSFLLLVPTVLGAVLLKGLQDVVLGDLPAGWKGPFLVGVLSAWGTGLLAIEWLLGYVRQHTYGLFVVYRLVAAAIIVLLIVTGARPAQKVAARAGHGPAGSSRGSEICLLDITRIIVRGEPSTFFGCVATVTHAVPHATTTAETAAPTLALCPRPHRCPWPHPWLAALTREVDRASWRCLHPADVGTAPSCSVALTPAVRTGLAGSRDPLVLDPRT